MKLNRRGKKFVKVVGGSIVLIGVIAIILFLVMGSSIKFKSERTIEINSEVDFASFIEEVKDGKVEDVKIDSSNVDLGKLGEYTVVYQFKDNEETLKIKVVDTTAPEFDTVAQSVAINQKVDPQDLVTNVKDATKTTASLKKDYVFDKEGSIEVEVTLTDEGDNQTTKTVELIVVKDTTAPELVVSNEKFVVGSDIDLKLLAKVTDDIDKHPTLTVEGDLDANKIGTYSIKFIAKDASSNTVDKTVTITIVEKTAANEKVVYLTFDDGPSKFTESVLNILDQYNCKATFFITGMNASYRNYIKIAHDKGHTIGLHTYSHNYAQVYSSVDAYFDDLTQVGNLARDYIGFVPKYIRFPGGGSNSVSKKYTPGIMSKLTKMVGDKGYIYYDWNAENGDGYAKMEKSEMLRRATSSTANQVMILMHDANGKQNTVDILPQVIQHYQNRGYTFKAIDDSTFVPHQPVNN